MIVSVLTVSFCIASAVTYWLWAKSGTLADEESPVAISQEAQLQNDSVLPRENCGDAVGNSVKPFADEEAPVASDDIRLEITTLCEI